MIYLFVSAFYRGLPRDKLLACCPHILSWFRYWLWSPTTLLSDSPY